MRKPVDNFDSWYDAQGYGVKTDYGYHEGSDLNLKTGGDTDLGQPLFAIADGEVTSVHNHSGVPTFGNHVHIQHDGQWGRIYSHYAHCQEVFVKLGDKVKEGQRIATLGKSGTKYAHLHFAIKLMPTGIDSIAKTTEDLKKWTDPIPFILEWERKINNNMDWLKQMFIELGIDLNKSEQEIRGSVQNVIDGYKRYKDYEEKITKLQKALEGALAESATWEARYQQAYESGEELKAQIAEKNRFIGEKDTQIIQLQHQLEGIKGKICITEEDYKKLTDTSVLKRYSKWQLFKAIFWRG